MSFAITLDKKCYTDDDVFALKKFCKSRGLDTSWVDIYQWSSGVSNKACMEHMAKLCENRNILVPTGYGLTNSTLVPDDII